MCKIRKVKILPMLDIASMGFLIGQGIGRWGNFFNHEAFGSNTGLPWGMTSGKIQNWIAENCDTSVVSPDLPVHPCFLYESIWCLLGFGVLFLISKHRKYDGQMLLLYIFWYGIERAFVEGLRTDSLMVGNIRISQLLAIVSSMTAFILLLVIGSKIKRMGEDYVFYKDTEESKLLLAQAEERNAKGAKNKASSEKNDKTEDSEAYESIAAPEDEENIN